MDSFKNINFLILKIFAPILILTGVLGHIIPAEYSLMSTANYYNLFHIVAGTIGLAVVINRNLKTVRAFNVIFGVLDLYQATASIFCLFPNSLINYTNTDDIVHIVIGIFLIVVGLFCNKNVSETEDASQDF